MKKEPYQIAYDQAFAELSGILKEFETLRLRKEQIEKVVDALRSFQGVEVATSVAKPEADDVISKMAEQEYEPAASFLQVTEPAGEPVNAAVGMTSKPSEISKESLRQPVAFFGSPSSDPFQRRIDDALWGWQQRPEGLLSPI